jgi:hypothetical protein
MNLEIIISCEISQAQKDILHDLIYRWNLEKATPIEMENKTGVTSGWQVGRLRTRLNT